jgi:hypothetical protein
MLKRITNNARNGKKNITSNASCLLLFLIEVLWGLLLGTDIERAKDDRQDEFHANDREPFEAKRICCICSDWGIESR